MATPAPHPQAYLTGTGGQDTDIDDLKLLAGMIGIESADAALQIVTGFYPDEPIPPRTDAVLRELFG